MKSINANLGQDNFEKLIFISKSAHPEYFNNPTLSGKVVDSIVSYCIEKVYNDIYSKLNISDAPLPLIPPITKKSQKLYNLYQVANSLRKAGKTNAHIVHHMNSNQEPTPDDVFDRKPLKGSKPTRWKKEDVEFLLDVNVLNEFLDALNHRSQRIITSTSTAEKP
ncbi:hypothetical protein [Serratia fonticola]|uniref:hypothetical protein n=1 Tax=Serratia fonticola TaxID=47917 RepID=UPI0016493EA5|nr:hypothetical protein [Serratia fonticola]MBC3227482.1 hypothetical protein [Serratia fonticola]